MRRSKAANLVTIEDIARQLGLSPSTVSRALNDSPLISERTRQRVRAAAEALGYRRNELARALTKGTLRFIGLLIPDITNPFFAEVARGVEDIASARRYGVLLCNTDESLAKEQQYAHFLREHQVSGLILTSPTVDDPCVQELLHTGTPLVLVSRITHVSEVSYVCTDDVQGAILAVEHLIRLGHRAIGFIGGPPEVTPNQRRLQGYRQALQAHNLPFREEITRHGGSFTQEAGYIIMKEYLQLNSPPTAVFAANDLIALGAIEAIVEEGLSVPEDVAIVGYDDIPFASLPGVELTTVAQPVYEMGALAAEYLLDVLEGKRRKRLWKIFRPRLIVRKTCGAALARGRLTSNQADQ
jgi:DNA-binding LacI/PurR family transcriptional regulator